MALKPRGTQEEFSEINVIPLVDIILVILIIFMVIAPLVNKGSLDIKLPKSGSTSQIKTPQLEIFITSSGQYKLNQLEMDKETLKSELKAKFLANANIVVNISADQSVSHGQVVEILDIANIIGITQLGISVERK